MLLVFWQMMGGIFTTQLANCFLKPNAHLTESFFNLESKAEILREM